MRDVEPVLAAEGEEEVVARDARHLLRLEAEQLPDAVILVDDEVAAAQVGEGGERAAEALVRPRRALAEDLRVGQEDEAELAPDEAAPRGRDREQELRLLGQVLTGVEHARVGPLEQVVGAQRLAGVRERDDDAVAAVDEALQLVLRLGEAAGGDRGPLRLERERLRLREGIELGRALERDLARAPPRPRRGCTSSGCQTKSGRAVEHRHEVVRHLRHVRLLLVVDERRLAQVGPPLDSGIDDGAVDRMQRPLGEGRERAHLLDLVAVELDPERLAARRREDVDEAAADGELAALLRTLHPLVARERELLREAVEAGLGSDLEPDRLRRASQRAACPRRARSPRRRRGRRTRARRVRGPARRRDAAAARARSPSGRRGQAAARRCRRR